MKKPKGTDLGVNASFGPRILRILESSEKIPNGLRYSNHRNLYARLKSLANGGVVNFPQEYKVFKTKRPTTSQKLLLNGLVAQMITDKELVFRNVDFGEEKAMNVLFWLRSHGFVGWERLARPDTVRKLFKLGHRLFTCDLGQLSILANYNQYQDVLEVWRASFSDRAVWACEAFVTLVQIPRGESTLWNSSLCFVLASLSTWYAHDPLMAVHERVLVKEITSKNPKFKVTENCIVYNLGKEK